MQIVVLADASHREELTKQGAPDSVVWVATPDDFLKHSSADVFIDLLFENTIERKTILTQLLPKPVIVNSVVDTLKEINASFVRINAWNTFLSSALIEAACNNEEARENAGRVFALFGKGLQWLDDEPGFIAARIVSTIINEAYLALSEGISTKEEINTAMKLGTAYPFGPFEWAEKIGERNVVALLQRLSKTQERYKPVSR